MSPDENPFGMTLAGFDVRHLVMVAQARHPAAPAYGNSAVAFPMAEPVLHAELLRGAADVFERQAAHPLRTGRGLRGLTGASQARRVGHTSLGAQ